MIDFLQNGTVRGAVNVPALNAEQLRLLKPYLNLAEALGSFFGQAFGHTINEMTVEYRGNVADLDTTTLTAGRSGWSFFAGDRTPGIL